MNLEKIKQFAQRLNEAGVPLPLIRLEGKPTLTGTMTVMSFTTALIGQAGKLAGFLGGIDLSQANYLFMICLGAYLGRKFQGNGTTKTVNIESKESETK